MLTLPSVLTLVAGKTKFTPKQKMAFAKGVLAHIAIQAAYRRQHAGNLIVCETMVRIGMQKLLSLTRFSAFTKYGKKLVDAGRAARLLKKAAPGQEDLVSMVIYLLDIATNEATAAGASRKRYDIIDFGPLAAGSFKIAPAWAYEIKPLSDVSDGRAYVKRQVDAFNNTVIALGATVAQAMGVPGLDLLRAMPGPQWPLFPYILPLGSNVLMFDWLEPGLIVYEWLQWKRISLASVWELCGKVQAEVMTHIKPKIVYPTAQEMMQGALVVGGALALVAAALVAVELLAAGALVEAISGGAILARLTPLLRGFAASSPLLAATAGAAPQPKDRLASLAAISAGYAALGNLRGFAPAQGGEAVPGGVPEAPDAAALLADAVAGEFLHRILVKAGQGNELYDAHGVENIRITLREWLQGYIAAFGREAFLAQFGEDEMTVDAAFRIAAAMISLGEQFTLGTETAVIILEMISLSAEDIEESLPKDCNDDGELPG